MEPGLYYDVSFRDYLQLPYPSSTTIKVGQRVSMSHMRAAVDGKLRDIDTTAKRFGRAFHCWLLEPERFRESHRIQVHCMETIKSGARQGQNCTSWATRRDEDGKWFCGTHGKGLPEVEDFLTPSELRDIEGVGKSLERHPVKRLLSQPGSAEVTVIADVFGVRVKCRYDWYMASQNLIVDVKKIQSLAKMQKYRAPDDHLRKQIRDYGYDVQATLYCAAHQAVLGEPAQFMWLFCEDSEPYEIIPRFLSDGLRQVGDRKLQPTLEEWQRCEETGEYPGFVGDQRDEPESWYLEPSEWETE